MPILIKLCFLRYFLTVAKDFFFKLEISFLTFFLVFLFFITTPTVPFLVLPNLILLLTFLVFFLCFFLIDFKGGGG